MTHNSYSRLRPHPPVTVIFGSARREGNTRRLVDAVFPPGAPARIVDLSDLWIAPYDYAHSFGADDFRPLIRAAVKGEAIVFASPVYWYSMSGPMKIFFDRLTDLLKVEKPLARALAGKHAFLISTSGGDAPPPSFEWPFAETARYFRMRWGGALHARGDDKPLGAAAETKAAAFADKIGKAVLARCE